MSIKSDAFSRVALSGKDAKKFRRQVTYGRPSAAAIESVKRGVKLANTYHKRGKLDIRLKEPV